MFIVLELQDDLDTTNFYPQRVNTDHIVRYYRMPGANYTVVRFSDKTDLLCKNTPADIDRVIMVGAESQAYINRGPHA